MSLMRTIEGALFPAEEHPELGLGLSVYLGGAADPALAGLQEGERVLLIEPNELQATGVARQVLIRDQGYCFGELESRQAI
jgi:hypothetical protein